MNIQTPDQVIPKGDTLSVHSIFPTIQGEGPFAGHPALFIRLAGCNLQCPLCDTDYTSVQTPMTIDAILDSVNEIFNEIPGKLIVLTGGEPFRQPIEKLVDSLLLFDYIVQIETNGTYWRDLPYSDKNLTIVCSPKTGRINDKLARWIKAFKYVATESSISEDDGLPLHALDHGAHPVLFRDIRDHQDVYLQPVDERNKVKNLNNQKAVVNSCLKHGHILCLQLHKIVGVE